MNFSYSRKWALTMMGSTYTILVGKTHILLFLIIVLMGYSSGQRNILPSGVSFNDSRIELYRVSSHLGFERILSGARCNSPGHISFQRRVRKAASIHCVNGWISTYAPYGCLVSAITSPDCLIIHDV